MDEQLHATEPDRSGEPVAGTPCASDESFEIPDQAEVLLKEDGSPAVIMHEIVEDCGSLTEPDAELQAFLDDLPEVPLEKDLLRLRELVLARELSLLEKLKLCVLKPHYSAKMVSRVLSEAVLLNGQDPKLRASLEPMVDSIIQRSLRRHQADFVNVLFPLMGPSIRKSISETFRSMLGNFSKSLEMSFSWRGLCWRWEALRAGKPFSEIVLLHTLIYRVEQIFFIHSETGLVLAHLVDEGVGSQDADMISAMLTAIQDFARDAFSGNSTRGGVGQVSELESLRMGDSTICIEKSPRAYLACVVRGIPPDSFYSQLRMTLELLLMEFSDQLAEFEGDTDPFLGALRHLEECMVSRYVEQDGSLPLGIKLIPFLLLAALIGGIGRHQYVARQEAEATRLEAERQQQEAEAALAARLALEAQKDRILSVLQEEPGMMVIHVEGNGPPWQVSVLRDVEAPSPEALLADKGLDLSLMTFRVMSFVSYEPEIIKRRLYTGIDLPESVHMHYEEDGTLVFEGTASMEWMIRARDYARSLPGITKVDMSQVYDPLLDRLATLRSEVESVSIEFPMGKDTPTGAEYTKLEKTVATLVEMEKLVQGLGFSLSLTVYGHTDTVGSATRNYELSQDRTRTVAAMLYAKGSSIPISMYGMGSQYPKESMVSPPAAVKGNQASRRIEFRVHVMRTATAESDLFR